MPPGPDGDDEDLEEISVEIEGPPPVPGLARSGQEAGNFAPDLLIEAEDTEPNRDVAAPPPPPPDLPPPPPDLLEITDAVELRSPIVEAADEDPRAERALYEAEVAVAEGGRRGTLLLELARLRENDPPSADAAIETARGAFGTDPASVRALWVLRRLLTRAGRWEELGALYDQAIRARPPGADPLGRADLLVERGRLLEDRLGRAADAVASYREALAASADHPAALLSLLLAGARASDATLQAEALGGLARRADAPARRAALAVEAARAWRTLDGPDGAAHALEAIEGELAHADEGAPTGMLLVELEALCRGVPAPIAARALEELGRRVASADAGLAVALGRERARLLVRELDAPEAAFEALEEAARLDPAHPLVAAERLELALALDRPEAADEIAHGFVASAVGDDEAVDFAIAYVEMIFDTARPEAALQILQTPRVQVCRAHRGDLRALELALAIGRRDGRALGGALGAEAELLAKTDEASGTTALIAAAAVHAVTLGETEVARDLFKRAIEGAPGSARARPAVQALAASLAAGGKIEEATAALEGALASLGLESGDGGDAQIAFETWARGALVAHYADEIGSPGRAVVHQRRLVALHPREIAGRVRLGDLDLQAAGADRLSPRERADNLLALADLAADPAVEVALRVAGGRSLVEATEPGEIVRGVALLREVASADATGLAAAALERASPAECGEVVAAELAGAGEDAPAERTRALRFRLAHHRAAAGRYAEALAALTPLRSEGDPLARAWSYELGRRSGDAFLEVAVISEETRAPDGALGDEGTVLLAQGEALVRAGDPQAAAEAFRRTLARAPAGETATDAALALFRLATVDGAGGAAALPEAFEGLARALGDEPELAAAAAREAALAGAASGAAAAARQPVAQALDTPSFDSPSSGAEVTLLSFMNGARAGDARAVAASLVQVALGLAGPDGGLPPEAIPLLGRAAARARLGGGSVADAVAASVWQAAHPAALAPAWTDLPVAAGAPWPPSRPDPRRSRARRAGGALGVALHLEAALDAERTGELGAALAAYGSVIALDPDRLEAWTGVRRVARAGGDLLGEARALARLGALVRDPARAATLLVESGGAYERAGRVDDAIAVLSRAVELRPDDAAAYARTHALLRANLNAPGRAAAFDGLLSYRLAAGTPTSAERIALLVERAEHRLTRLQDRGAAFEDLKQILKIDPGHVASLYKLAEGALADQDARGAAQWLERYLAAAGSEDDARVAAAKLDLAASYDARGEPVRAVETLRRAAAAQPHDPTPLERMSDIQLRRRDLRGAVQALREAVERTRDPRARSAIALRIGTILRDVGRDPAGAAAAFRQAADLDPLGAGAATLVALHDAAEDARGALEVVEREVADLRRALALTPLDARRLERLAQWLGEAQRRGAAGVFAEAAAAIDNVRALAAGRPVAAPAPRALQPKTGRAFIVEIGEPAAGGFASEVWPHLIEAAAALFPAAARARPGALAPETAARLSWIAPLAAAVGIPRLALVQAREQGAPMVAAVEEPDAALVLSAGAPTASGLRFHAGRALGLIAARAGVLERTSAADLAPLFSCAALLAGAAVPAGLPKPSETLLRDVTRALGRKDRKALVLQSSRFGFETLDIEQWRTAVLRAVDRFGLFVAGDPALAAVALAGDARAVAGHPAAIDLLGFALGDRYPALRKAIEGSER